MGQSVQRGSPADWTIVTAWADLHGTAIAAGSTAIDIWMETANAILGNYAGYLGERARRNAELWAQLAACTSPAEVMDLQQKFSEQIWQSCRDETERLAELAGSGLCAMACEARGGDKLKERVAARAA